jgi:hypothetical protein
MSGEPRAARKGEGPLAATNFFSAPDRSLWTRVPSPLFVTQMVWLCGSFCALAVLTALVVALTQVHTGIEPRSASPGSLDEALATALANTRVLALVGVAGGALAMTRAAGSGEALVRTWCDVALAGVWAMNAILVGIVIGSLGLDVLPRILPHLPLELGGFALAGAAYLEARGGPTRWVLVLDLGSGAVLMLALAAAVESFVSGAA